MLVNKYLKKHTHTTHTHHKLPYYHHLRLKQPGVTQKHDFSLLQVDDFKHI